MNQDGFKPNLETHLVPLLSTRCEEELTESNEKGATRSSKAWHHPQLLKVITDLSTCIVVVDITMYLRVSGIGPYSYAAISMSL